jgi:hypothetical protein
MNECFHFDEYYSLYLDVLVKIGVDSKGEEADESN